MELKELTAGVHRLKPIEQPMRIVPAPGVAVWDAILEPLDDRNGNTLDAYAPLSVTGCRIRGGVQCLKSYRSGDDGDEDTVVELDNCWVHGSRRHGLLANGSLLILRCLIEQCGLNHQYHHGVYPCGDTVISHSILRGNGGYQVSHAGDQKLKLRHCLILGKRAFSAESADRLQVRNCTYQGEVYLGQDSFVPHKSNIDVDVADKELPYWQVHAARHLFWLAERAKGWDGRGCYPYDDRFYPDPDSVKAIAYASKLWYKGYMAPYHDSWQEAYPQPHWPGDPLPEVG